MMGILSKFFELSPYIEVIIRRIYWGSPMLINLISKHNTHSKGKTTDVITENNAYKNILDYLQKNGVKDGSLLIVHSSAEALKSTGKSPKDLINGLIDLLGPDGTLAMPAFPKYKEEPSGFERINADVSDLVLEYNVEKSIPWTGLLPYKLMKYPGSVRSRHPLNSMVALGPLARPMMEKNLEGERVLPCGVNSSWNFCVENNAKIIALGVDMAHSLTMIHVAEDSYECLWPVVGWYRDRRYTVIDKEFKREVVVRERHPKWAAYYAERTLSKDLKKNKLLASRVIDGILVEVLAAGDLLDFLNARKNTAYPYFMVPLSRKKNGSN